MKFPIIFGLGICAVVMMTNVNSAKAYSYAGIRWPGSTPNVTVSIDSSIPTAWYQPFAYAMIAWNNAGSKLRFSSYSGGSHVVSLKKAWFASWLAQTTTSYSGSSIYDCDVVFNARYSWDVNGAAGKYDAWEVMTHELGHWLTLNDLYGSGDKEKTMYGYAATGETKQRTLTSDDVLGVRAIYGVK